MIGRARAVVLAGIAGHLVDVEAHLAASLPGFSIVGLPDASLHESRDRVRAAVTSSGLAWPNRRITVNLSPASLPKGGSALDVAIAVAVLAAAGLVDARSAARLTCIGELGLDGAVRGVRGVLPAVAAAVAWGAGRVVVPSENAAEARLVGGADVVAIGSLGELAQLLGNEKAVRAPSPTVLAAAPDGRREEVPDLADVRGQELPRFALEVAAAGAHHLLMVGPPGAGKTMLASRLPGILPDLSDEDAVAATAVHSLSGTFDPDGGLLRRPPFEAPHHSASAAAIVGGGSLLARPGAISRAHAGVLFLDDATNLVLHLSLYSPTTSGPEVQHGASARGSANQNLLAVDRARGA